MDSTTVYNYVEVGLWSCFAIGLAIAATRSSGRRRTILLMAATGFVAFAASDWIEAGTGAWWRPWWLLVLKAGCLATLLGCGLAWRRLFGSLPTTGDKSTQDE